MPAECRKCQVHGPRRVQGAPALVTEYPQLRGRQTSHFGGRVWFQPVFLAQVHQSRSHEAEPGYNREEADRSQTLRSQVRLARAALAGRELL